MSWEPSLLTKASCAKSADGIVSDVATQATNMTEVRLIATRPETLPH
jgi:hypothetical protein